MLLASTQSQAGWPRQHGGGRLEEGQAQLWVLLRRHAAAATTNNNAADSPDPPGSPKPLGLSPVIICTWSALLFLRLSTHWYGASSGQVGDLGLV